MIAIAINCSELLYCSLLVGSVEELVYSVGTNMVRSREEYQSVQMGKTILRERDKDSESRCERARKRYL